MNLKFLTLVMENFGCFSGKHRFNFDRVSGLYFVSGRNLATPQLTTNGVGKSTLFNALFWVICGKTLRTQRPGASIESWYAKSTVKVTLDLEINNITYQITRTRKPNSLTVNGQVVEQSVINDLIHLNDETAKRTIFIGQFVPLFLDLKPEAQSSLFSEALNLDQWLTASEKASQEARNYEQQIQKTELNKASLKGRLDQLVEQYDLEIMREKQFNLNKKKARSELQHQMALEREKLERAQSALREQEVSREAPGTSHEELIALRSRERDKSASLSRVDATLRTRQREREINHDNLKRYLSSEVCPECGQAVEHEHIQEKVKVLQQEDNLLAEFVDNAQREHDSLAFEVSRIRKQLFSVENAQAYILECQRKDSEAKRAFDAATYKVEQISSELIKNKKAVNPHTESCTELADTYLKVEEQIKDLEVTLSDLHESGSIYKYWTSAFKEIRLNLIDETLQELEIVANRHIQALGLDDWRIEFKTERETKSGTVSHTFTTLIYPNGQTNPIPFESYSGGESQRLQLAVTTALSEILLARAGISPNIEVMDEATRGLSQQGINDLLECLRERAIELNRAIYFIDHSSLESGFFDQVITVEKTSTGSRLLEA